MLGGIDFNPYFCLQLINNKESKIQKKQMNKLKFHIVGLTHSDVKNHEVEYAKQALGKTICLVPDDDNVCDLIAVRAYDEDDVAVGFVGALESEDVRAAIIASHDVSLRTTCVGWGSKGENDKSGLYLKVEAMIRATDEELELARSKMYDDREYDDWHYTGPILTIDKLARFSASTRMLEDLIGHIIRIQNFLEENRKNSLESNQKDALDANQKTSFQEPLAFSEIEDLESELGNFLLEAKKRLRKFLENQRNDYSRETTQARNQLLKKLALVKDEEVQKFREELLTEMGFITSSSYREKAAQCFFVDTPTEILARQTGTYDYRDQLDQIEQQLEAFPFNLYRTFKADPVDFLRQVFYKRVPRRKMQQLLSGIILMIMNGRVNDVKQWGKHGNEESLLAMKTVGKKPAIGEHKKELMELVKKAVLKIAVYQKRGYYGVFLSKKVYWYPVFRLMGDWELLPSNSPQSFCTFLEELFEGKKISGPKAPLCGRDDLRQAGVAPFSNHKALEWKCLQQEELVNTQEAKFNRYCEIVDVFMGILREEAFKKGIILDDWLKK